MIDPINVGHNDLYFVVQSFLLIMRASNYVPHRTGGGHIVFGADPVGTLLYARYLMNQCVDCN